MATTTVTFATVGNQAEVEFVNDRSKPGWDDLLASDLPARQQVDTDEGAKRADLQESASRRKSEVR